jgi:hypothetical protein
MHMHTMSMCFLDVRMCVLNLSFGRRFAAGAYPNAPILPQAQSCASFRGFWRWKCRFEAGLQVRVRQHVECSHGADESTSWPLRRLYDLHEVVLLLRTEDVF